MNIIAKICIACATLIILIFAVVLIVIKRSKKNKAKKSDVGKIMKTTDGYFAENPKNIKNRNVAVIAQRKKDGAVAVVKLHEDKPGKSQDNLIPGIKLTPQNHPALEKVTVVEKRVYYGTKSRKPIFKGDLTDTGDKLSVKEKKIIDRGAGGSSKKNQKTRKRTTRNWRKGFPKHKNEEK